MPRANLFRSTDLPYHVCARANNREWFYLPINEVWEVFTDLLGVLAKDYSVRIHAFVLMSNHFHMLMTTPHENLDEAMLYFMREGAREINRRAGRINHIFGGPYKWSLVGSRRHYEHVTRYVYQNPVKAGITQQVQDYKYSTLYYLYRQQELPFPVSDSIFEKEGVMDLLLWQKTHFLNQRYTDDEREVIRRSLRHSVFKVPKTYNIAQVAALGLRSD
jgi:putative transposase